MFFNKIDLALFLPAALLTLIGGIILSSVAPKAYPLQYLYLGLSLITFLVFSKIDTRLLKSFAPFFYGISILLLASTVFFGALSRGAVRWIDVGLTTFQPSEIVKPLLLVFFSWIVARSNSNSKYFIAGSSLIFPALFIFIQPDLGSMVVLVAGFLGVIYMAGIPAKFMTVSGLLAIIVTPLSWIFLADFQKTRILSFLNPEGSALSSGYNSIQAKIAVGSGEFFGRGLGQGTQSQLLFLPERHTDFIFSSISEELGFIGGFLIILCFGLILLRLIWLIKENNDIFVKSLLGGIFMTIFVQSVINIGMNVGVLPITGIPLPFVSSGGSALLAMSATLGIASSLASQNKSHSYF